jgi:poly(3-hydroxybutyrate) depolymerase
MGSSGGTWDLTADPPKLANFLDRMIKAFHVDADRVHVDGFSQGSAMTFWFLCIRHELLASAAPVSGATDVSCLDDAWQPRVPIFYENGQKTKPRRFGLNATTCTTGQIAINWGELALQWFIDHPRHH